MDSYLEFLFWHFELFILHARLHDAAVAVRVHSDKIPGYSYMIRGETNFCLPRQKTGLLFCFHKKLFLPSNFNSVDFRNSRFWIVKYIELAQ